MQSKGTSLAAISGFGQVFDCGSCGNIHVQVGPMTITLEPGAYMQLVDMISTSAAHFETWLQERNSSCASPSAWTEADLERLQGGIE